MNELLQPGLVRLAERLQLRLLELRKRGRTRRLDPIGGLAIEPGDAEGILAELLADNSMTVVAGESLTDGIATFEHAGRCFGLSSYERDILLLALAPEIDARFCRLFGYLNDSIVALRATVGLAVSLLGSASERSVAAFLPDSPLVELGILVTEGDAPLAGRPIRLASDMWPRLAGLRSRAKPAVSLPHATALSGSMVLAMSAAVRAIREGMAPLVVVTGQRASEVARSMASELGAETKIEAATASDAHARQATVRAALWERTPVVVEAPIATADLLALVRSPGKPPIVAVVEEQQLASVLHGVNRPLLEIQTAPFHHEARANVWRGQGLDRLGVDVEALAHHFRFGPDRVAAVRTLATARAAARGDREPQPDDVLGACRSIGAAGNTRLARKLETAFVAEDLVVPHATRSELALFETAAREGHALFGPGTRGGDIRGATGFIALFAGPPGTGKTMAAQIVAQRLDVDLVRIDLSQVVDKYIGETEKHLEAVFRDAEASGAMLFFDEADALFGKRTEVKDAHDRYSNIETAFLLQRLEQHPGVVVLATNLAHNLDTAFLRRLHFVIEFPLPGPIERRTIWERHLSAQSLGGDVDLTFLARFELAGGDIRNAIVAAVLLSSGEERVTMRHLMIAIARELRKAGRVAQPDLFGPWRDAVLQHIRGDSSASPNAPAIAQLVNRRA